MFGHVQFPFACLFVNIHYGTTGGGSMDYKVCFGLMPEMVQLDGPNTDPYVALQRVVI